MTLRAYEGLYTACLDMAIPDAPITTTPNAEDDETRGFTTNAQRRSAHTRKELQQLLIVQNTLRRKFAFDYESDFYRELNAVSNAECIAA